MPDLRYHVISLISVFLALAVGVLLGIALADNGVLEDQLNARIEGIEADLAQQRKLLAEKDDEIAALQERTGAEERVLSSMSEAMISDRLEGVDVALVTGPWAQEATLEGLQSDLSAAGATLTSVTTLEPPQPSAPQETRDFYVEQAREAAGNADGDTTGETTGETTSEIASETTEVTAGETTGAPGDLDDDPEVMVFLGGGDPPPGTPAETLDLLGDAEQAMFEVWAGEPELRVVAAESSGNERSEVRLFESAGVSSVDNADLPAGRAGLILLAANLVADGSYGAKPTASDLFPPAPG